ncbi:MAG: helix-turn-helix domain-containing protein [Pseudomonadota bacterium]
MQKIAILSYNGSALFELGCAVELFALPRPEFEQWYECDVVSFNPGPLKTTGGLTLSARQIESLHEYDCLIVPSWPTQISQLQGLLAEQVVEFYQAGKRILTFCSGAFLLAGLGLLNGREATTHWRYAEKFQSRFPAINYVPDVLYLYDGQIGCSAGSASAIDLGLEVIRQDFGRQIANQVARRMVISAHRKGGQSQYVETPVLPNPGRFAEALDWAIANIDRSYSIDMLADKANMSRRTFDRRFRSAFNMAPNQWLINQRLRVARQLLETEQSTVEQIATYAGFDNASSMRHHFRKSMGISPRQYRDQFAIS